MVIELSVGGLLMVLGIPTAITSLGLWLLQRRISKWEAVQDAREAAREKNEVLLIQNTRGGAGRWQRPPPRRCSAPGRPLQRGHARRPGIRPQSQTRPKGFFDRAGRQSDLLRAAAMRPLFLARLFFLALLGMAEILWRDWKGGHEK